MRFFDHRSWRSCFELINSLCQKLGNAHIDVMMTSSKMQKIFTLVSVTLIVLERFYAYKQWDWRILVATFMKDNRLSFQKIYRKSQISFSFFDQIAIEVECFLQNFTKNHEICEAFFETLGPSVVNCRAQKCLLMMFIVLLQFKGKFRFMYFYKNPKLGRTDRLS